MASDQEDRNKEILLMNEAGLTPEAIADEMGLSPAAIRSIVKKSGLKTQPRKAGYSVQDVIRDYEEGKALQSISAEYGISISTIYQVLSENDVPIRKIKFANTRQRQLDEAVAMYEGGAKISVITAETGIHQPTLHTELSRRNVPLRRPHRG